MSKPIIETKNLGKKFSIPRVDKTTSTSQFSLSSVFSAFRRKQDFWAVRHLNLEIQRGDVVAVMGGNGSGKSTLFRLLSEITAPDEGEVILRGSISSMIEVGVGFHHELSGKENIYLNGALMGMSRREISERFDQIVTFSGVGKYLNTPMKKYSNGMYARLAFAVASHLKTDILIVDEVLSVSDQAFRQKSVNRLQQLAREGVTILIVSHDTQLLKTLCNSAIHLKQGQLIDQGEFEPLYSRYGNQLQEHPA